MAGLFDDRYTIPPEPEFDDPEETDRPSAEISAETEETEAVEAAPDAEEETPLPPFKVRELDDDFLTRPVAPVPREEELTFDPIDESEVTTPRHIYKVSSAETDLSDYMMPPLDDPIPEEEPSGWSTAWAITREVGETIILTLIIFFLIQTVVRNFRVVGTSMLNNLHDGQYLIIDKLTYSSLFTEVIGVGGPQRGDVVVFEPPNRPDDDYVKRIIGLPGETVEVVNGQVIVNGEPLPEPFQPTRGTYSSPPQVVPEDQVYVLGDNRNNSNDSHTWGPLPIENIVGRAWVSYWPPEQWGTIPRDAPTEEATIKYLVGEILTPSANAESK